MRHLLGIVCGEGEELYDAVVSAAKNTIRVYTYGRFRACLHACVRMCVPTRGCFSASLKTSCCKCGICKHSG